MTGEIRIQIVLDSMPCFILTKNVIGVLSYCTENSS